MIKVDTELAQQLKVALAETDLSVTELQQQQLVGYVQLMHKWNKAYNLTSVRNPAEMLVKHILDSIVVAPYLQGTRFIDVGTGPGLPGIPLAIMLPDKHFYLLDSLGKRVRFMRQAGHELGLKNITPIQSRVEEFQPPEKLDAVLSRAFASIKDMLHWCQHLVDSSGAFLALKGVYPEQEIAEIAADFHVNDVVKLAVPGLQGDRHLVHISKR